MKGVKEIRIVFENCEAISLSPRDMGAVIIGGVNESIKRIACNAIELIKYADTVAIEVFTRKLDNHTRLTDFKDITIINAIYEDDTEDDFYVSWDGENDFENEYQKVLRGAFDNLYIVIDKEKSINDFFEKEYIENEEKIRFIQKMVWEED